MRFNRNIGTTLIGLVGLCLTSDGVLAGEDCNLNGVADVLDLTPTPQMQMTEQFLGDLPQAITALAIDQNGTRVPLDVNGDGHTDLAIDHHSPPGVTIALNDGAGSFPFSAFFAVGSNGSWAVAAGDLDADGDHDLAVINADDSAVFTLFNTGLGAFVDGAEYLLTISPLHGAIGDLNGDGHLDIVAVGSSGQTSAVSVMFNQGGGTYEAATDYQLPGASRTVEIGDLNGDGFPDLVVDMQESFYVLLNQGGTGQFPFSGQIAAGATLHSAGVIDVNDDGDLDLIGTSIADEMLVIVRNLGGGFFDAPELSPINTPAAWTAISDLNGDGLVDVAVSSAQGITMLQNEGQGVLSTPILASGSVSEGPGLTTGDFDGNGYMDLAALDGPGETLQVSLNHPAPPLSLDCNGNGTPDECDVGSQTDFGPATSYAAGFVQEDLTAGDLDGDGDLDLVVASHGDDRVSVLINQGDGTYADGVSYLAGMSTGPWDVATGDFDGDGDLDLTTANIVSANLSILVNQGDGTFGPPLMIGLLTAQEAVTTADLDADGDVDIAAATQNTGVAILLNDGAGNFDMSFPALGSLASGIVAAHFDGDSTLDLAVTLRDDDSVAILLGDGAGGFGPPIYTYAGTTPEGVTAADFDADGHQDLAVANRGFANGGHSTVSILMNDGQAGFTAAPELTGLDTARRLDAADFDGDGDPDLAVANAGSMLVSVFINQSGVFAPVALQFEAVNPIGIAAVDADGDSAPDLALSSFDSVEIILNGTLTAESPDCNGNGAPDACDIAAGTSEDTDGDGIPDECPSPPCAADVTGDGEIDVDDLVQVIVTWGACPGSAPCNADITGDGFVDVDDLVAVIVAWGSCS